jgi:hypothetical protein
VVAHSWAPSSGNRTTRLVSDGSGELGMIRVSAGTSESALVGPYPGNEHPAWPGATWAWTVRLVRPFVPNRPRSSGTLTDLLVPGAPSRGARDGPCIIRRAA